MQFLKSGSSNAQEIPLWPLQNGGVSLCYALGYVGASRWLAFEGMIYSLQILKVSPSPILSIFDLP